MTFTIALMIAVSYWGARDVRVPCHPHLVDVSAAEMGAWDAGDGVRALMRTDRAKCVIYQGEFARDEARIWFPTYCAAVVHEVGHVAGLSHAYGGVMRADGSGHVPWGCAHRHQWLRRHGYLRRARRGRGCRGAPAAPRSRCACCRGRSRR